MNATHSGSFGDSQSARLLDNWIDGLLIQKVRKILDTTIKYHTGRWIYSCLAWETSWK